MSSKRGGGVIAAKLDKIKRVKAVARKRVGTPPPGRALEEDRRDKPKHKKMWSEEE